MMPDDALAALAEAVAEKLRPADVSNADTLQETVWSQAFIDTLPDSSFAFIAKGGKKQDGKTRPLSLRHLPYKDKDGKVDLPHLRNALARLSQTDAIPDDEKPHILKTLQTALQHGDGKKQEADDTPADDVTEASAAPVLTPTAPKATSTTSSFNPKEKIATIQVIWCRDGAKSLNGRIYPREAVDQLVQSAQRRISDPNGLPVTCFINHEMADTDNTRQLIGRIERVWKESSTALADIAIADTNAGRDAVALIKGGYLKTESLRASGAELKLDRESGMPMVTGAHLQLDGIDLTSFPGLQDTARIEQLLLESARQQQATSLEANTEQGARLCEVFAIDRPPRLLTVQEPISPKENEPPMGTALTEDTLPTLVSGNTPGLSDDPTQSAYAKRTMPEAPVATGSTIPTAPNGDDEAIHGHLAQVLDAVLNYKAHGSAESAPRDSVTEAGRKLAKKHVAHLMEAHDQVAHKLGLACEGVYTRQDAPGSDDMDDGDENGTSQETLQPSAVHQTKENTPMTPDEAAKLLEQAGYTIQAPKTAEEKLQEAINAKLAEADAKHQADLAEMKKLIEAAQPAAPGRKSLVEGSNAEERVSNVQRATVHNGAYLQEQLKQVDSEALADRSAPLPKGIALEQLLDHYKGALIGQAFHRYGVPGSNEWL